MSGKGKMKVVMRSDDGERVYYEDSKGRLRAFRTLRGKFVNYGDELETGKIISDPLLSDSWRDGQPLTAEGIAYRKGFRACFAELERMKRGNKKRR